MVDVVITDQAMPHMTGVQLADVIHDVWPDLPVILATGYAELEPGAGEGMRKLSKPFTEVELSDELARMPSKKVAGRVVGLKRRSPSYNGRVFFTCAGPGELAGAGFAGE